MSGINVRGYIRVYVDLFTNNIYFGNTEDAMPLGQALLDFIYANLDSFLDPLACVPGSFHHVHPYFRNRSDDWEATFLRNLTADQPQPGFYTTEQLIRIQSDYLQIMQEIFSEGFDYTSAKSASVLLSHVTKLTETRSYNMLTLSAGENQECRLDYFLNSFEDVLYVELLEVLRHQVNIIPCRNCGKLFIPKRINSDYCPRIFTADGKTCAEIGYTRTFHMSMKNDDLLLAYTKAYKAHYARMTKPRKRVRNMTREEFSVWYREAKEKLAKARAGLLDPEEYKAWLKI